jgi:hypothetical protein
MGVVTFVALACATRPFDAETLAARHPELSAAGSRRLAEATPYFLPVAGRVTWFLCRFDTELPVAVALPANASAGESHAIEAALTALERAGLGVRFQRVAPSEAGIVIELFDGPALSPRGEETANTVADCEIGADAFGQTPLDPIPAQLRFASIHIGRRTPQDLRHRDRVLTREELAGTALHELAHALGLQGHAAGRGTVLVRSLDVVRGLGRDVLAGRPLADVALGALYAVPSGTVLATSAVSPTRTQLIDRMVEVATRSDLAGPYVRVGEDVARLFWRSKAGVEYGFRMTTLERTLLDPRRLVVLPEARTRAVLPRSWDLPLV